MTRSPKRRSTTLVCAATALLACATAPLISGCTGEAYASPEGKSPPYILKDGCTFTIVGENGSAGISSPKVTGMSEDAVSASTSFGKYSITVSSCRVVENSHGLPIYEE